MLFAQDTRLLAQQLLPSSGRVTGEPRLVTDTLAPRVDTRDGVFSLSADGALTYGSGDPVETTSMSTRSQGTPARLPARTRRGAFVRAVARRTRCCQRPGPRWWQWTISGRWISRAIDWCA